MRVLIFALIAGFSLSSWAQCFPKDDSHRGIVIGESAKSGITKSQYDQVLTILERAYAPVVAMHGGNLKVNRLWNDKEVNAQAWRDGTTWNLDMFGGLARYPGMTPMGMLMVACHELGHHIGGAPRYDNNTDWAATEGQADYFAAEKCMKFLKRSPTSGSMALAKVLADLGGEPVPNRSGRDASKVRSTYEAHPGAQCRLDTMDAGRVCKVGGDFSKNDPRVGSCFDYPNDVAGIGSRPRCWFKP